jgi:hypothetical protein
MALQMLPMMELLAGLVLLEQHGLHVRTGMSVPKNVAFLAFSLAHRLQRDGQLFFLFCFSFSVFNGRLLSLKMDGNVIF